MSFPKGIRVSLAAPTNRVPHFRDGSIVAKVGWLPHYTSYMHKALLAALLVAFNPHVQAQWQIQDAHTTADLRGIDSLGDGLAWASGSGGTVLRTEDNGAHWQRCTTPPGAEKLDFRGIQAFDKNTAIAMSSGKGDLSRLYKTTDGCQTWKLVFTNPDVDGFWDSLRFEPANPQLINQVRCGVLVGDPVQGRFAVFRSSDLGETWPRVTAKGANARPGESLFAASNTAADAPGDKGDLIFVTGGKRGSNVFHLLGDSLVLDTWYAPETFERTPVKFPKATDAQGAFSIAHRQIDQTTFDYMIVGGDYANPTSEGSAVFLAAPSYSFFFRHQPTYSATVPPHGYRSAVAYDKAHNTWITVGPNGTDISTDDGRNWRALKPDPKFNDTPDADAHWNALSLPFAVGPHGRIGLRDGTPATP